MKTFLIAILFVATLAALPGVAQVLPQIYVETFHLQDRIEKLEQRVLALESK